MSIKIIFSLFLLNLSICLVKSQDKFNIFKSYANSEKKPIQYSKKNHLRHSVEEYLDPIQLKMLKKRKNPDQPVDMFDNTWSGSKNHIKLY